MKPILCLDFDGVIHSYEHGWQDGKLYGTVTPGFFTWANRAEKDFRLVIHSSRAADLQQRAAMWRWLLKHWKVWQDTNPGLFTLDALAIVAMKPPAFLTIDDRCIQFNGNWGNFNPTDLLNFRTWREKGEA